MEDADDDGEKAMAKAATMVTTMMAVLSTTAVAVISTTTMPTGRRLW
jgi:hypothetical protein